MKFGIIEQPQNSPTWISPTLVNGWTNYGGSYATLQYTKLSIGLVLVKGVLKNTGTPQDGDRIFTLAAGYRPVLNRGFVCGASNSAVYLINTGQVQFAVGNKNYFPVEMIFYAEQ